MQIFRDITWPAIAPVAATVVLIRLIEAFKIIDLPNVLTGGGPGLATESMTLHAFIAWRTQDLGGSAAVGYMLLFVSTVVCVSFFNFVVRHAAEVRGMSEPDDRLASGAASSSRASIEEQAPVAQGRDLRAAPPLVAGRADPALLGASSPRSRAPGEVDNGPFYLPFVDFQPNLDAWRFMLIENNTLRPYMNSVVVALGSTVLAVLIGSLAAYALVRIRFRVKLAAVAIFLLLLVAVDRRRRRPSSVPWQLALGVALALFLLALFTVGRAHPARASATTTSSSGSSRTGSCRRSSRCCRST